MNSTKEQKLLKKRAHLIFHRLQELYPEAHCELDYSNPLELLVATILSAQCTDVRVNKVTPALFQRCPSVTDYASITQEELEQLIHSTGFFRSKATAIRRTAEALIKEHGGHVPQSQHKLSALPGVGRKTANVVLSNAFDIHEGIAVDTHVKRLSQRLDLTKQQYPEKIEQDLMKLFDTPDWGKLSHYLVWHGRRCCFARKPNCADCLLHDICPSAYSSNFSKVASGGAPKPLALV
ncbi:MAG: endonuclease III [Chthoniobacterales bacterium]|nr:endonuclease III [Chthoniobacterales bacterium]